MVKAFDSWNKYSKGVTMLYCKFCQRESKTNNSKAQHELYCKSNPNKRYKVPSYGMLGKKNLTNNNQWSNPNYVISETTRQKLVTAGKNQQWSEERKAKHRISMAKAVENNPESYTSSNRGRTKQIIYEGMKFQGTWELDFYKWCTVNNILCQRNIEGFKYVWNGQRTYYPDFYLPNLQLYIEVKGYKTERDIAKWEQFPKKLRVIEKNDIILARKNELRL